MDFNTIAYDFLKRCKIKISKNYLQERLQSHPEYPSLKSLTDLLDEFGIENIVLHIKEKERWKELDFPFLTYVISENGGGDFEIIKNNNSVSSESEFLSRWSGIVLLIDNKQKILHTEHNVQFKKERSFKRLLWSILIILFGLFLLNQLLQFELGLFIHFLLSLGGLAVSCAIVALGMGLKSNISELFCKVEKLGCNKVLNSKLGRFGDSVGLGDVSAIFFSSWLLYLPFSFQFENYQNLKLFSIIYTFASLFTIISLVYQWQLKSWCKLCLMIISILWIQSLNIAFHLPKPLTFSNYFIQIPLRAYLIFGMSFCLAFFWLVVKPLVLLKQAQLYDKIRIRKWRQDPNWFSVLLPLHKRIDDTVWAKEIFYGNPNGVLQIIVVSDPYCHYCSQAHHELNKILNDHPNDIGVRIRFTFKSLDSTNKIYQAAFAIINAYEELVWKTSTHDSNDLMKNIVADWFEHQNLLSFNEKFNTSFNEHQQIDALLKNSKKWADSIEITQTPSFFINGYEMPNPHTFKDLFLFASDYIEILKKQKD